MVCKGAASAYSESYRNRNGDILRQKAKQRRDRNKESLKIVFALFYRKHRQRILEKRKAWRIAHPEASAAAAALWRQRNPDRAAALGKAWVDRNRVRARQIKDKYQKSPNGRIHRTIGNHRRRARMVQAAGQYSTAQFKDRWDYYGGRCWMCSGSADGMDHVKPLSRGGSNWPSNLRPACRPCNARKGTKEATEWLQRPRK